MARGYIPVDRDRQFLLPPDVRGWLPEDHLVWFVIDVVEQLDTSVLHARHPREGAGRRAYDPEMLLALLIYAYCTKQRSSRQIERLCEVDVAYRVICANHVPDHTTIARFRQHFAADVVGLFADVLELCAAAGLVKVGVVAVDGTKFAADAALRANRTRARIEAEIRTMFAEAEQVDTAEDDEFGEISATSYLTSWLIGVVGSSASVRSPTSWNVSPSPSSRDRSGPCRLSAASSAWRSSRWPSSQDA